jgi:hypothetical protein
VTQATIVEQSWWLCKQGAHSWSKKLCFETVRLSTLTKPILKDVFIKYIQYKVVQLIMQFSKETTFYVDIQWLKNIFVKSNTCINNYKVQIYPKNDSINYKTWWNI